MFLTSRDLFPREEMAISPQETLALMFPALKK